MIQESISCNAGSFLRKELGEALRNTEKLRKDLTLFLRRLTACTANMI